MKSEAAVSSLTCSFVLGKMAAALSVWAIYCHPRQPFHASLTWLAVRRSSRANGPSSHREVRLARHSASSLLFAAAQRVCKFECSSRELQTDICHVLYAQTRALLCAKIWGHFLLVVSAGLTWPIACSLLHCAQSAWFSPHFSHQLTSFFACTELRRPFHQLSVKLLSELALC